MPNLSRLLRISIGVLFVFNLCAGIVAWYVWSSPDHSSTASSCTQQIASYLQHSNRRMYDYFTLYDQINHTATPTLADSLMALTKDIAPLPTNCPSDINNVLYANYTSVYMTTPIHLHIIITRSTAEGIENARTRQALILFYREVDVAERTAYQLNAYPAE